MSGDFEAAKRLADALRPPEREATRRGAPTPVRRRKGIITAWNRTAGTVSVIAGNETWEEVPYLAAVTPLVLDTCWMENVDGAPIVRDVYPRAWLAMSLVNGATNWGGRAEGAACRPIPGRRVVIRGVILLGASGVGASCLTIPTLFRPTYTHYITASAGGSPGSPTLAVVQATAAGDLLVSTGVNSDFLRLDGITWSLD